VSTSNPPAPGQIEPAQPGSKRFTAWHAGTALLLALGYSGYYFCRSDLSVVLPVLIRDLAQHGITPNEAQIKLGFMASVGTVAYAFGKFFSGALADTGGGRRSFLGGMAGSIFFTVVFAMSGGFPLFTLAWIGNRLFQSQGWAALVRVSSRWFSYSTYGSVMAVVSLSFFFGDAGCRWMMSQLMAHGVGWRGVFFFASGALAVLMLTCLLLLREAPEERGLPAPEVNPRNVYADEDWAREDGAREARAREARAHEDRAAAKETGGSEPVGLGAILRPLLLSFPFWMVCVLAFGTTMLRETFNLWTPTYFVQFAGLTPSAAASRSALFPLCGGISVLLGGFLSDRLGPNGRNILVVIGMSGCTACLVLMGRIPDHSGQWAPTILVALVGFMLLGPYSYLAGAMSLDFGGKHGSATAAGIIDGFGYMAGWLSGDTVARIAVDFGWRRAFLSLAVVSLLTAIVAMVLAAHQRRAPRVVSRIVS
jgi:OPA family glycerol-3-phosphate transporter-like MFS transporter